MAAEGPGKQSHGLSNEPSVAGLGLQQLPPSVLVAVYERLGSAEEVVRAALVCKSIWHVVSAAQFRKVNTIHFTCFHPELQHCLRTLAQQFPATQILNLTDCSALPEPWLHPVAAVWKIQNLDVTRLWHWTGSDCLPFWANSLTRFVADDTSFPMLEVPRGESVTAVGWPSEAVGTAGRAAAAAAAGGSAVATASRLPAHVADSGDGIADVEPGSAAALAQQQQRGDRQGLPGFAIASAVPVQTAAAAAAASTDASVTAAANINSIRNGATTGPLIQQQQQQRARGPHAWLHQMRNLRELHLSGLACDPVRCKTHGTRSCQCEEDTLLSVLLSNNPGLTFLDLSNNPQLPDRLLHWALTRSTGSLRTLDLSGCDQIRPGYIGSCCCDLQRLDVSGTAADDADMAILAEGLSELTHLNIKGCRKVSDPGIHAIARGHPIKSGQLQFLNLSGLTRTHTGSILSLLCTFAMGCERMQRSHRSSSSSSSSGGRGSLHLGLSHTAGVSVVILVSLAVNSQRTAADVERDAQLMDMFESSLTIDDDHKAQEPQLEAAADTERQPAAAAAAAPENLRGDTEQQLPCFTFSGLELAGCNRVDGSSLELTASHGLLADLKVLDLSDIEELRSSNVSSAAAGSAPVVDAAAAQAAAVSSESRCAYSHPAVAAVPYSILGQIFQYTGSQIRSLTLDGCYLDDLTAAYIGNRCPMLAHLSVVGCRGLQSNGLHALISSSPDWSASISSIDESGGSNSDSRSSCSSSSSSGGLRSLSIGGSSSAWKEQEALSGLTSLTELRVLRRSHVTDAELAPVLASNQQLQRLSLVGCHTLTDKLFETAGRCCSSSSTGSGDLQQQPTHVGSLSQLTYLSLTACDGLKGLSVARLRSLRHLRVSFCASISKVAVQQLAVACKNLTLLELPAQLQGDLSPQIVSFPIPGFGYRRGQGEVSNSSSSGRYSRAGGAGLAGAGGLLLPKQGPGGHLHGLKVVCV